MAEEQALPLNFSSFVISLDASAMFHLGETPDPVSGKKTKNIALAEQTVALLEILKEKTAGNLDEQEQEVLDTVLTDLHQRLKAAS